MGPGQFRVDASIANLPNLMISSVTNSSYEIKRGAALVADGDDRINLNILRRGNITVKQGGHEVTVSGGDAILWTNGRIGSANYHSPGNRLVVTIPRQMLAGAVVDLDRSMMLALPRGNVALELLAGYAQGLLNEADEMPPALRALGAAHVHDLVAIALGATRDAAEIANGRGVRVARLSAIKADIEQSLGHRNLSLDGLARRHGISPRYIRALFSGEGTSFTDYVMARRLLRAHAAVVDPRNADHKISAIAFEAGFGDLSHFNQAFRKRFGMTPSDARLLSLSR